MTDADKSLLPYLKSRPPSRYVTHARTPMELKNEFLSDIARRQSLIDLQIKNSTSARRAANLAMVRQELDSIFEFWNEIELRHVHREKS